MLLNSRVADEGVVDGDAAELEVFLVIGGDESIGDVRDVIASIGFASDVGRGAFEGKGGDEVAPEAGELLAEFDFVGDVGFALAEADADGLLNPDDVCSGELDMEVSEEGTYLQVRPTVRVGRGRERALLP